ncbi:hypothetical protein TNCV_2258281 [Trichonephila clavipes]|nr:hypothetical protein TNCV_2258281 [Trichonephila clavipes]
MPNNPFNANLEILPSNPFHEWESYNEDHSIPLNVLPNNCTNEDVEKNNIPKNPINDNLEIFPSNPFYGRISNNENYHFIPTSLNASRDNRVDENGQENFVESSRTKKVFRKGKSFFKRLRTDERHGFTYKRFN